MWMADLGDPRTCLSCIAMHGTIHSFDEELNDHYNGRCAALPLLGENPIAVSGEQWFDDQPEAGQRALMGPSMYAAWQDGAITFDQLTAEHADDVFGTMKQEASLLGILGDRAKDYYGK